MPNPRYGWNWEDDLNDLEIEFECIKAGGKWRQNKGPWCGQGLFYHYKQAMSIVWPEDDHHRWSDLILDTILRERITVVQGARDTGKTRTLSKYALIDYWAWPDETLILMSSTDTRGLELRVWGDIKDLVQRAREQFDWLPGIVSDSKHGIFTDSLDDTDDVRNMRRGIICIPCLGSDGQWAGGLEKFVGIKQKRRRLIGDEVQFMHINYITTLSNLDKGDFKGVFVGNPIGGNGKALDKLAEPEKGWDSIGEVTKTITWRNRFDGLTIDLVGTDSPNFDENRVKNYPYLIDQTDVDKVAKRSGKDSAEYWSQIMGVRKIGVDAHRVLTRSLCLQFEAFKDCIWQGTPTTKILGIDAGFGGDPCESIVIEFGEEVGGRIVLKFHPTVMIPIMIGDAYPSPENQIATFVRDFAQRMSIPPDNIFVEAGMRVTLGIEMAKIIGPSVTSINAGGPTTNRPVNNDMYVFDEKLMTRRLKKCSEHYIKFITEMWYSVREAVISGQVREIPENVVEQFAMREWEEAPGGRYELETKEKCKARMGESPNRADAAAIALEGARRRGFKIARIAAETTISKNDLWLEQMARKSRELTRSKELNFTS